MASLRDLQLGFASALRGGDASAIAHCIVTNGLAPERRVGIYVNNVRETFLGTLEATFPLLARLAGRDWLRHAGRRYWQLHPSRHGNLHHVGAQFPAWLVAEVADGEYAYFVDVARLEWAYQEVLVAAEPGTLDLAALAAVPESRQGALVLEFSSAARLVESVYPLLAIREANRPEVDDPPAVRLDARPCRLLLIRRADHVELRELPPDDFALLQAIARRRPLGVALEAALAADPGCDVAASLSRCVRLGAVTGFHLTNP
ncbi:MAG: DNA-binding domain-containing protein [Steroidobacteraceae bacterium]|nr:DNA-binding domain-containing protein [Steroidobacteraceae bacterium]